MACNTAAGASRTVGLRLAPFAVALALVAGCSRPAAPPPTLLERDGAQGHPVLLVTIDTLRRDRLGAYGSSGGLTPILDGLAVRGVRVDLCVLARAA